MATVIFVFELIQAHKHVKQQFEHCNNSDTNIYIIKMGGVLYRLLDQLQHTCWAFVVCGAEQYELFIAERSEATNLDDGSPILS